MSACQLCLGIISDISYFASMQVNRGSLLPNTGAASAFITTPYHENLLAEMLMSHSAYDICLIGSKVSLQGLDELASAPLFLYLYTAASTLGAIIPS